MSDSGSVAAALDDLPTGPFHYRLLLVTGAILSFAAVELLVVSFVLPALTDQWGLTGVQAGLLGSASLVGVMLGNWGGGWYADRVGRVAGLQWSVLGYSVCAGLTALAVGFYSAFVLRLLTGVLVGATIAVNVTYFTEHLPASKRGRYTVYLELFWPLGTLLSVAFAWLVLVVLARDGAAFGVDAWRLLFVVAALPGLATPVLRRALRESPYYLESVGRIEDANDRLREIAGENDHERVTVPDAADEATEPGNESDADSNGSPGESASGFRRLFAEDLVADTALASLLWFALNFGYYGLFIWLPSTLQAVQLGGSTYEQLFVVALVQVPGAASAALLIDRAGRRPTIGGYLLLAGVFMALFADAIATTPLVAPVLGAPPLAHLFLASFFLIGAWGSSFAYTAELFPTTVRSTGFGFASGVGKVGSIVAPVAAGALVPIGYGAALAPFGVGFAVAGLVVLAAGPETADTALA